MAIPDFVLNIEPFWDDEYKHLDYACEPFNDTAQSDKWIKMGFPGKFTGDMCDLRKPQPTWNHQFINKFKMMGWRDIGTSYYRMTPGTILPEHKDIYKKYVELFNLQNKLHTIRRAVVFLEDWKPGHYFEIKGVPVVNWKKGFTVLWANDTPHAAANLGMQNRYTLQITGHI